MEHYPMLLLCLLLTLTDLWGKVDSISTQIKVNSLPKPVLSTVPKHPVKGQQVLVKCKVENLPITNEGGFEIALYRNSNKLLTQPPVDKCDYMKMICSYVLSFNDLNSTSQAKYVCQARRISHSNPSTQEVVLFLAFKDHPLTIPPKWKTTIVTPTRGNTHVKSLPTIPEELRPTNVMTSMSTSRNPQMISPDSTTVTRTSTILPKPVLSMVPKHPVKDRPLTIPPKWKTTIVTPTRGSTHVKSLPTIPEELTPTNVMTSMSTSRNPHISPDSTTVTRTSTILPNNGITHHPNTYAEHLQTSFLGFIMTQRANEVKELDQETVSNRPSAAIPVGTTVGALATLSSLGFVAFLIRQRKRQSSPSEGLTESHSSADCL